MDIPFGIFVMYSTIALNIGILGIWLGVSKRMDGAPFITVFAGFMFLLPIVLIENIDMAYLEGNAEDIIYNVPNTLATADISASGQYIRAEYPSASNSMLIGERFDCIEVNLRKVNSPPVDTLVQIGVFNANGDIVSEFGTINVTNITTDFFFYTECLPEGEYYIIGSLPSQVERIGIKWNDGDGTNRIQTRFDNTNPFDSTTTYLSSYNGVSWSDATTSDLTMILNLRGGDAETVSYAFNENDIWVFSIMLGILFLFTGIMIQFAKLGGDVR